MHDECGRRTSNPRGVFETGWEKLLASDSGTVFAVTVAVVAWDLQRNPNEFNLQSKLWTSLEKRFEDQSLRSSRPAEGPKRKMLYDVMDLSKSHNSINLLRTHVVNNMVSLRTVIDQIELLDISLHESEG